MPPIQVPGSGSYSSKIIFCGEAPGPHEVSKGIPFVGPSGDILWNICSEFKYQNREFNRDQVYTTNVVKIRCPGNNIKRIKETGYSIEDYLPLLWEEINAVKPNVILAIGNTALAALTRVIPLNGTGILKYRGSILPTDPYSYKTIPTIHPASLIHSEQGQKELFSWKQIQYLRFDINKLLEQADFPDIRYHKRQLLIAKTGYDLYQFFRKYEGSNYPLAIDIETFKSIPICIAFSFTPYEGISVPLVNLTGPRGSIELPLHEKTEIFKIIARVLADPAIQKIGHNLAFDITILCRWGFIVNNVYADTVLGAGIIYPELEKNLGNQVSIYTNEAYHKNEGKEYNPKKDPPSVLLNYNTKDTVTDQEVFTGQLEDMNDLHIKDFYFDFMMPCFHLYREIERVGLKVDSEQRSKLDKKYQDMINEEKKELENLVGEKVNFNSPKQVAHLIFGTLGCPTRSGVDDETLQALKNNVLSKSTKWDKAIKAIDHILHLRKTHKALNTYVRFLPINGRAYTTYQLTKETGRTSTNILKPPLAHRKFGLSFHTITKHGDVGRDVRSMFVPDEDHVFLEADQSQAEARIVLLLAKEYKVLEMFDLIDIHLLTASWIFKCDIAELKRLKETDKEEYTQRRQLGKKARHAGGYGMGANRLSQLANIKQKKADYILRTFHKFTPGIQEVFHKGIQEELLSNDCCLYTPFGRFRKFYEKWGDKLFKEAYAHIPQSTIADNTKRAMLGIKRDFPELKICIESHDGFTSIVHKQAIQDVAKRIKYHMESPIDFSKCSLIRPEIFIPCEFKLYEKNLEIGEDYII